MGLKGLTRLYNVYSQQIEKITTYVALYMKDETCAKTTKSEEEKRGRRNVYKEENLFIEAYCASDK